MRGNGPRARSELFLPSLPREPPSLWPRGPPSAPRHLPWPWDTWQARKRGMEAVVPDYGRAPGLVWARGLLRWPGSYLRGR